MAQSVQIRFRGIPETVTYINKYIAPVQYLCAIYFYSIELALFLNRICLILLLHLGQISFAQIRAILVSPHSGHVFFSVLRNFARAVPGFILAIAPPPGLRA
jgi:hypothetical protein